MRRIVLSLAVASLVTACGSDDGTVSLCGRGDRSELAAALAGGTLELSFVDRGGAVLDLISVPVDRPSQLSAPPPGGAARVNVIGREASGAVVARGSSELDGGDACVCVALDAQHLAACAGVTCRVVGDLCTFDGDVGEQTLSIGDNPDDDLPGRAMDTYLSAADGERDLTFGDADQIVVAADPVGATGLVRVDVSGLPRTSVIEHADLELSACGEDSCDATGTLAAFEVFEAWDEGAGDAPCATWNCRQDGTAWTVPGCGYLSELDRSRSPVALGVATVDGGGAVTLDLTAAVTRWVADPDSNLGVALAVAEAGAVELTSREAAAGTRPRLRVTYRIVDPEGDPDAGPGGGIDAGGDGGLAGDEVVLVPAGEFTMGCDPDAPSTVCEADEEPAHTVMLAVFEIDRTEVTQEAYGACVTAGDCTEPFCSWDPDARPRYPVTCVTNAQAATYCTTAGKRLPTEAEWEKAARGDDGRRYPWGDEPLTCARANGFGCVGGTQPVGLRPEGESPYGARDMAGNASEWVADFYGADYYADSPAADPTGPDSGASFIRRGGAFNGADSALTVFDRFEMGQAARHESIGFRCARDQ